MILIRLILAFVFPPLAVLDKGCGALLLVFTLTLAGWFPGVLAAVLVVLLDAIRQEPPPARVVVVPARASRGVVIPNSDAAPAKRGPRYLEASDGSALEIVDAPDSVDDDLLARRQRLGGGR
ncbi:MAG: YqaE/Pmp3 family membrane protein [Aggregatilineales bacterium]